MITKKQSAMPKKARELSPLQLEKAIRERKVKPNGGKIAVGGVDGLYLRVAPGGSTNWILFYSKGAQINSKGESITHRVSSALYPDRSNYPTVSLKQARERAREIRWGLLNGIDPAEEHRKTKAARIRQDNRQTFAQCAEIVIQQKIQDLRNPKAAMQWRSTLETYVFPTIGNHKVDDITKHDIVKILEPLWRSKTETATRLRGRIAAVFDYAKAMEYRTSDNPAEWKGTLEPILGKPKKTVKHHAALPYLQIGIFMAELRQCAGIAARALEFAILTAARSNEVRGATWSEIDLKAQTWIIPAHRMKAHKEHAIPLSDSAIELLHRLTPSRIVGEPHLFPSPHGGKPLSDMTLLAVLKRMGREELTIHGFRSTFRDWAGEQTAHAREVIEHALAHQLKDKAEAAYQRGTLWPKRIALMTDWANYCHPEGRKILPLTG